MSTQEADSFEKAMALAMEEYRKGKKASPQPEPEKKEKIPEYPEEIKSMFGGIVEEEKPKDLAVPDLSMPDIGQGGWVATASPAVFSRYSSILGQNVEQRMQIETQNSVIDSQRRATRTTEELAELRVDEWQKNDTIIFTNPNRSKTMIKNISTIVTIVLVIVGLIVYENDIPFQQTINSFASKPIDLAIVAVAVIAALFIMARLRRKTVS